MKFLILILIGAFCLQANAQNNSIKRHWGGGVVISQSKFPAVVQIEIDMVKKRGKGYCTASVIGPRTILTAAHCAFETAEIKIDKPPYAKYVDAIPEQGKKGRFSIGKENYNFQFITHAENTVEIGDRTKLDVAIGITDKPITVSPLTLNFTKDHGSKMVMLGYGCTGQLSETFMQTRASSPGDEHQVFLISNDNKEVHLCGGDSGGPGLAYTSELKLQISGVHRGTNNFSVSWDTRTDNYLFLEFIAEQAHKNSLRICGYNLDCD